MHTPQGALSCPFGAIHLVSPEMTDFDFIPAAATAGTLRGFPSREFFDTLRPRTHWVRGLAASREVSCPKERYLYLSS